MANLGVVCCSLLVGFCSVLLLFSWTTVSATEMALQYHYLQKSIDSEVIMTPGVKFVGPFTYLYRYPKTLQQLEFSRDYNDQLASRTRDGLPIDIDIAVTYQLLPDSLQQLYTQYELNAGDYKRVYRLVAHHVLTEQATMFSAYEFFNEKQKIAEKMRVALDTYFRRHLFATVASLQINKDQLPDVFKDTITEAATRKQKISKTTKTRDAKVIEFQTARIVARAQANVTVQHAHGEVHKIQQNGRADAAVIEAFVEAELQAYSKIHKELELEGNDLIDYIYYDTLAGGGVSAGAQSQKNLNMFVGVSPSAYISEYKPS